MPSTKENKPFRSWIEISRNALLHNLATIEKLIGTPKKIACVVKANAYGHGLKEIVSILKDEDIGWFAVDSAEEALSIRSQGVQKSILVLGYTRLKDLKTCIERNISLTVYNQEHLKKVLSLKLNTTAKIHLKVETGLNRQGVSKFELLKLVRYIERHNKKLFLEGLSTHFANVEDTLDPSFAREQLSRFEDALNFLKKKNIKIPFSHTAGSAAAFLYPETHFKMVRAGIALYGLWPSKETKMAFSLKEKDRNLILKPVLTWKSIVAQVKYIEKGESVGYGRTWFAPRKTKVAIIPVGYFDGYDRKLSNNSRVLIRGKYSPVVGRVAMNMIVVNVTNNPKIEAEDEVILIGKSGANNLTADELADRLNTINYEVVTRINSALPRIIKYEED